MAGVNPDAWAQTSLILELRWRLLRNLLRTTRGQVELVAQGVATLAGAAAGLGLGIGFAAAAYFLPEPDSPIRPAMLLWAIFLFWQLAPALLAVAATHFDFRGLLQFPLRFSVFWWLSVVYGLSDPAAFLALLWLGCVAFGLMLARPDALPSAVFALAVFAVANLFISRATFVWLERLLATRRTREIAGVLGLLVVLCVQFLSPLVIEAWEKGRLSGVAWLLPLAELLPPQLAGRAVTGTLTGDWVAVARGVVGLTAYGLGFGLLFTRRLRALYRGEELSETQAAQPREALVVRAGWRLPALAPTIATVLEKELRYALRNGPMLMNLVLPPLMLVFITVPLAMADGKPNTQFSLDRVGEMLFPAAVAYSAVLFLPFAYNTFGYDGQGVQLWLTAPVGMREVLVGKNLAHAGFFGLEVAVLGAVVSVLGQPPGLLVTLATLAALPAVLLVNLTVGNLMSVHFPRRFEFGTFRRQRPAGMTILVSTAVEGAVVGLAALLFMVGAMTGLLWAAAAVFLALGWLAWRLHTAVLLQCEQIAQRKRELFLAELCKV